MISDRTAETYGRGPARLSAACVCALALIGCGAPRQAMFTLEGCEAVAFAPASGLGATGWSQAVLPDPVLEPGEEGEWDAVDLLNPSVVRFGGSYVNLYSGFDGEVWRTGVARSEDGAVWEKLAANPVIEPDRATWEGGYIAANGAALERNGELLYWYQAGARGRTAIGLARSADGETFQKLATPVLSTGPPGSWDESGVGDPYALGCGENLYLYYLGQNRFGVQRLGVARSRDGVHWQKSHLNPLLEPGGAGEFDERGLGEPAVFLGPDGFRMLYTGRDGEERRALGWAISGDGVTWRKAPERGVMRGEQDWNRAVVCDPTFWFEGDRALLWFGGGNLFSPDEHLNGRVGFAVLSGLGRE